MKIESSADKYWSGAKTKRNEYILVFNKLGEDIEHWKYLH